MQSILLININYENIVKIEENVKEKKNKTVPLKVKNYFQFHLAFINLNYFDKGRQLLGIELVFLTNKLFFVKFLQLFLMTVKKCMKY